MTDVPDPPAGPRPAGQPVEDDLGGRLADGEAERDALRARLEGAVARVATAETENATLAAQVADARRELGRLRDLHHQVSQALATRAERLESERAGRTALEADLQQAFEALAQMHRREERAVREAAAARSRGAAKGGAWRAVRRLASARPRSLRELVDLPSTLWGEARRAAATGRPAPADTRPVTLPSGGGKLYLPLTLSPHAVRVPPAAQPREVWLGLIGPSRAAADTLELTILDGHTAARSGIDDASSRAPGDGARPAHLRLRSGESIRVLSLVPSEESIVLRLQRRDGPLCLLSIELRTVAARADLPPAGGAAPSGTRASLGSMPQSEPSYRRDADPPAPRCFSAADLDRKLWGGFARYAAPELEQLKEDRQRSAAEREEAAWSLARWYFVGRDFTRALENLAYARLLGGRPAPHQLVMMARCLLAAGRHAEAAAVVEEGEREFGTPDFALLRSTVVRRIGIEEGRGREMIEVAQLAALNGVLTAAELTPIEKRRGDAPLTLANITSRAPGCAVPGAPLVSILVPAHNAAGTLTFAVESLLSQTWRNLEVLIVDDGSTDETWTLAQDLAARDARVRPLRQAENCGAYPSRNAALEQARGDFVTVHDSDDWSHPQRIELHVAALRNDAAAVGSMSFWVRVDEHLEVVGSAVPKGTLYDLSYASLMVRRTVLRAVGPWDDVRVGGDAELCSRLKARYGDDAIVKLPRRRILTLSLSRDESLTRAATTHQRSVFFGVRGSYRDAYLYGHARLSDARPCIQDPATGKRSFPLPLGNRPSHAGRVRYDVVVVSDFAMRGGALVSTLNYLQAARKAGKRVGAFHWRKYDLPCQAPLQPRFYETCNELGIDILCPGDSVAADFALFGYPAILQHRIDPFIDIQAHRVVVIVNQFAHRLATGEDEQYDPLTVRAHLRALFGDEGVFVPISGWIGRLMTHDARYPAPYPVAWAPMIDVEAWCTAPLRWRGAERRAPVVGRHGRDEYTKWPTSATSLAAAYGAYRQWEVRILGGASRAEEILGRRPSNWRVFRYDAMTAQEFLTDLDFFVHYPHEQWIEAFGRVVIEAMAVGVPVILPPQFEQTFGSAATYSAPEDVAEVLEALWASEERYLACAEAGRAFVLRNCDMRSFGRRLEDLLTHATNDLPPAAAPRASGGPEAVTSR